MKNFIFFLLLLLGSGPVAKAQSGAPASLALSVVAAQELGLKNRFDVQANAYDVAIAQKEVVRSRQARLPNVRIASDVRYSPQLQGTLVPGGFAGFSDPVIIALGAKSISIFSLELNQSIFNPATAIDIKQAQNQEALQKEQNRGAEIEIKKRIRLAYLNVLLRELQLKIARQEEARFGEYFSVAEGRFNNGAIIENDYLRVQLDYENARQQTVFSNQNYLLSLISLHYQTNIPEEVKLILTDSLGDPGTVAIDPVNADFVQNRTEIKQLQLQKGANLLQEQRQRRAVLPTLSFVGNYSAQYLNQNFDYNYGNSRWWSPFNSLGLRLTVPLSAHFTNRNSVEESQLRTAQSEALTQQKTTDIKYEVTQAQTDLQHAMQNIRTTKSSYELAQQVYKNQKAQLELGGLSYDNLFNTQSSLSNAESNYVSAVYQFMTAKLNYEVATGQL